MYVISALNAGVVRGQEDDEEPYLPGLIGRFERPDGTAFTRLDRAIAFDWSHNPADRRIETDRFHVEWRGRLQSQANGSYQFHAYVSGRLKIVLNGQTILEAATEQPQWHSSRPIELAFDYHPLTITYEKSKEKDAGRLALFWSGPQFQLEPIGGRQLFHDRETKADSTFEHGESLVRALRCGACHEIAGEPSSIAAPSLERLSGAMNPQWLVSWLTAALPRDTTSIETSRRMPHFAINEADARDITAWLFANSAKLPPAPSKAKKSEPPAKGKTKKKDKDAPEPPPKTPVELGRELVLSVGCLACHQLADLGSRGLFDGGDLSTIAAKRTTGFFERWFDSPEALNPQHRMPVFDLSDLERSQLVAYLKTLGDASNSPSTAVDSSRTNQGRQLVEQYRCNACHAMPGGAQSAVKKTNLTAQSNWSRGCIEPTSVERQPRFVLSGEDKAAIQSFISQLPRTSQPTPPQGNQTLTENNCLACHQRDESPGLASRLTQLGGLHPELAPLIPAMSPPALNSVGDKLHDAALRSAITRLGPPHRSYLLVRMPRFKLSEAELATLIDYFLSSDRIPEDAPSIKSVDKSDFEPALLGAVGNRLVTTDGFGCTSCHQVGRVLPAKAPLNARGPDLSMLGQRVRQQWFDRFVRNPARIVPRMEMPSVQLPVRGVVPDKIDQQLAAVWDVLNKPGFQPPEPNPVRVLRHTGIHSADRAMVVSDVVRAGSSTYVKPLLIGLSNRHNILFDLETARLASWSIGDTARQRTEGKTWFWEAGGQEILAAKFEGAELMLERSGANDAPRVMGQFVTEFDSLENVGNGLRIRYRLHFGESSRPIHVSQTLIPIIDSAGSGFRRQIALSGLSTDRVRLVLLSSQMSARAVRSMNGRTMTLADPSPIAISLRQPANAQWNGDGVFASATNGSLKFEIDYLTPLALDRFLTEPIPLPPLQAQSLQVVPGFSALRLPLSDEIMPTALGWRPDGTMVIASLKGQVWQALDSDRDGVADGLKVLSDGLAAPYGLHVEREYVDVATKYAVLRLYDDDRDESADRTVAIASGWGHTADYHDWAVGLPRDRAGNYYVALPCQQDQRSKAAARMRGEFLKLVPHQPTAEDPRQYSLQTISRGHRFPMGIALRRDGELFVTDNQGNYNPFNELNHIRPGAHFGFINAIEKANESRPTLTPPAIDLPHPWTRSVNGICFLETPEAVRQKTQRNVFGPFEGHLIGCEYDTRRLIRMSLQKVGGTFQGAAYPFSYDQPSQGDPFLGPIVCEVSPDGDLYVGGLRDSGWGGANNIGEVVRLRMSDQVPCGIAEMRATPGGFEIEFTSPVDRKLASQLENYSLASYTRESTPAYGGPDLDHRTESIKAVEVSEDGRRVALHLSDLRVGYVYELHVKQLVPANMEFFPAEAHFTLRKIP